MLSFFIDESIVKKIQKLHKDKSKGNEHWYENTAKASSQECQNYVDVPKVVRYRKRVGTITASCESVSLGYIELEMPEKQFGDERSCLQDAFINAGFLLDVDISTQLYNEVSPKRTINTKLVDVLKSCVIKTNFSIKKNPGIQQRKVAKNVSYYDVGRKQVYT